MKLVPWNRNRLNGIVALWNRELSKDFPMREELFEQNSFKDANVCYEGSKIAIHNDKVIGFVVAKRWQESTDVEMSDKTGWIQVLIVDEKYRGQGIGSQLLEHAESALKDAGIEHILLGRDPWHYFPGIPRQYEQVAEWFVTKGYQKQGSDYDLLRSYKNITNISEPTRDDVEFSLLEESEKDKLISFLRRSFPGRWEYEAIRYFEKGGTGREFIVVRKQGKIVGFCRINDSNSPIIAQNVYWAPLFKEKLGGVGPLGIGTTERGKGLGLAIVEAGIAELRKRGVQNIVIDWTGLVDFYKKLGYDIWKIYDAYKKSLSAKRDKIHTI